MAGQIVTARLRDASGGSPTSSRKLVSERLWFFCALLLSCFGGFLLHFNGKPWVLTQTLYTSQEGSSSVTRRLSYSRLKWKTRGANGMKLEATLVLMP
jgi:hypothetical protein